MIKQKRGLGRIKLTIWFLNAAIFLATLVALLSFYALSKTVTEVQYSSVWRINLVILQLGFVGVIFIFLVTILLLIHRALGPLPRMDKILDEVIKGNYSLRITIRKKDIMYSFVDKLNKILELLEQKTKS